MSVTLRDAREMPADRAWIDTVYAHYLTELAEQTQLGTGVFPIVSELESRRAELLAGFFQDRYANPLLLLDSGARVGFALVLTPNQRLPARAVSVSGHAIDYRMAEFYVVPSARRRGVGRMAAHLIFSRFAGQWETSEAMSNLPAVTFWRETVDDYTRGRYDEHLRDGDVRQWFVSAHRAT